MSLLQKFLTEQDYRDSQVAKLERKAVRQTFLIPPDPTRWISDCVTIEDPHDQSVTIIPFLLWPAQSEVLQTLQDFAQIIILKARQLGMSWLVLAYALWLCLYHANQTVMVFSKEQDSANEMVRRVRGMYQRLANKVVSLTIDNVQTLAWANGSRIKSFAATEDAGSSFTASLTILDEFAKMRYADSLYTSVKPTINDGGRIVIISTARGESNVFHMLWQAAIKAANSFKPVFLPWTARPGRDAAWYAKTEADAVSSASHQQEYPATPDEAFIYVGEERFLPSIALWDACREDLPPLGPREPLILAADAAVTVDSFGLVGITRHPARRADVAIRIAQEWKPVNGVIDFLGTDDNPGPEKTIRLLRQSYNIVQWCYDPYQLADMAQRFARENLFWCKAFSQQADRLEADKQLLDLILTRRIVHDGNAVLRKHIDNANRKPDPETRKLRIVKRAAGLKIDLAVCASMASAECLRLAL